MKEELLDKKIAEKNINGIYLFYGEERYILDSYVNKIKKAFGELIQGINYVLIDDNNINNLISDIETPAFGYDKKLIIVKNTNIMKKEGRKKTGITQIQEALSEYIQKNIDYINENLCIVIIEQDTDKIELLKTIEKLGIVCNFEKLKPIQIVEKLSRICKAYTVNVDNKTLSYLIEVSGTSMEVLINEIRKLIEHAGPDGTITIKDIEDLTIKQTEAVIFDLTDNLGDKKIKQALQVLNDLIYTKEPIQKILITLYNHFRKLYITKIAIENNENIEESLNLKPNQKFLVGKYKKQAGYFEKETLRKILEEFTLLDLNSKTGKIDINIGLESILCMYCSLI